MLRACGRRGRQARRRRDRQGPPPQRGHPGCLEFPLINLWNRLFSSCFGGFDRESESESEDAVGNRRSVMSTSPQGAQTGATPATPAAAVPAPARGVAANPANPGSAASPSPTSETVVAPPSPPTETNTVSPSSAPPFVPAGGGKAKSSLRACAPEWRPAASFGPTASPVSPSPRGGGGGAGFGVGSRGVNSGGSVHPRAMVMDMEEGAHGGGLHAWGGNSPHDHGGDGEWGMAARAAGVLEEVDSPARTTRHENAGAEAWAEWTR